MRIQKDFDDEVFVSERAKATTARTGSFLKLTKKVGSAITSVFISHMYVVLAIRSKQCELWETPLPQEQDVSVHSDVTSAMSHLRAQCDELAKLGYITDETLEDLQHRLGYDTDLYTLSYCKPHDTSDRVDLMLIRKGLKTI